MTVYKAFWKVLREYKVGVIVYIIIILALCAIVGRSGDDGGRMFKQEGYTILVVDHDNTNLSKCLTEYLGGIHTLKEGDYDEDTLKDLLYYETIVAYVEIPEGFETGWLAEWDDVKIRMVADDGLPAGMYIESQIDAYLTHLRDYVNLDMKIEDAHKKALVAADYGRLVSVVGEDADTRIASSMIAFLPYGLMGIILSGLLPVLLRFRRKEIHDRNLVAAYPAGKRTFELMLGTMSFAMVVFLLMAGLFLLMEGKGKETEELVTLLLNLLAFTLTVSMIATMLSMLPLKNTAQSGMITTVLSLAMAFLGGCFVPVALLGESVKRVGRFLPTYWYIETTERVKTGSGLIECLDCMGIQLLFGIACIAFGTVVAEIGNRKRG